MTRSSCRRASEPIDRLASDRSACSSHQDRRAPVTGPLLGPRIVSPRWSRGWSLRQLRGKGFGVASDPGDRDSMQGPVECPVSATVDACLVLWPLLAPNLVKTSGSGRPRQPEGHVKRKARACGQYSWESPLAAETNTSRSAFPGPSEDSQCSRFSSAQIVGDVRETKRKAALTSESGAGAFVSPGWTDVRRVVHW